jgi:hypothetical protein
MEEVEGQVAVRVALSRRLTKAARSMSGVEKRRSDSSLPVAIGGAFATPPQSGLT